MLQRENVLCACPSQVLAARVCTACAVQLPAACCAERLCSQWAACSCVMCSLALPASHCLQTGNMSGSSFAWGMRDLGYKVLRPLLFQEGALVGLPVGKLRAPLTGRSSFCMQPITGPTRAQGIHEVAYKGALARPLLCPESALAGLSADKLRAFHARNFTAPRMVLAAAGLPHSQLKQMADELLGGLPSAPASPAPASTYVGGDFRWVFTCGLWALSHACYLSLLGLCESFG